YLFDVEPTTYLHEGAILLKEKEQLLETIVENRKKLRKQMDALVPLRLEGELDKEHFAELYKPLEEQVLQLDASIPELEADIDFKRIQLASSDVVLTEAKALFNQWQVMSFEQKRGIVETITE